jgi:hypothetical protein
MQPGLMTGEAYAAYAHEQFARERCLPRSASSRSSGHEAERIGQ